MPKYLAQYKLAPGWEVKAELDAPSEDDAWQDACSMLDQQLYDFDSLRLKVRLINPQVRKKRATA